LILTGINNYIGATIVSSGVLQAASATALSSNSSFNVLGTVDLKGNSNTIGSLTGSGNVTDNGTLAFDRSDSVTFGGLINGTGTLVNLGSSALILTGNNSYSGGTAVDNGTVVTASNGALGTGPVSITGLASTYKSTRA
jgi:fibronectin-binding autotransporter adhesin